MYVPGTRCCRPVHRSSSNQFVEGPDSQLIEQINDMCSMHYFKSRPYYNVYKQLTDQASVLFKQLNWSNGKQVQQCADYLNQSIQLRVEFMNRFIFADQQHDPKTCSFLNKTRQQLLQCREWLASRSNGISIVEKPARQVDKQQLHAQPNELNARPIKRSFRRHNNQKDQVEQLVYSIVTDLVDVSKQIASKYVEPLLRTKCDDHPAATIQYQYSYFFLQDVVRAANASPSHLLSMSLEWIRNSDTWSICDFAFAYVDRLINLKNDFDAACRDYQMNKNDSYGCYDSSSDQYREIEWNFMVDVLDGFLDCKPTLEQAQWFKGMILLPTDKQSQHQRLQKQWLNQHFDSTNQYSIGRWLTTSLKQSIQDVNDMADSMERQLYCTTNSSKFRAAHRAVLVCMNHVIVVPKSDLKRLMSQSLDDMTVESTLLHLRLYNNDFNDLNHADSEQFEYGHYDSEFSSCESDSCCDAEDNVYSDDAAYDCGCSYD